MAPGAPSEDLSGKPAHGAAVRVAAAAVVEAIDAIDEAAPVDALNSLAAIDTIESQAVTTQTVSRADRAKPEAGTARAVPAQVYAQPQPRSQPASRAQTPTTASGPRAAMRADPPAAAGLHIGRIDVTVLAQAPRPAPAAPTSPLLDSQFLSRNYLRRT